jgi:hypothetical protein
MYPIVSYDHLREAVRESFQPGETIRIFGVVFASPDGRFVQENIFPALKTYDFRTGNIIDFYFAGYWNFSSEDGSFGFRDLPPVQWGGREFLEDWKFSDGAFKTLEEEIKQNLDIKKPLKGTADLLLAETTLVTNEEEPKLTIHIHPIALDLILLLKDEIYPDLNHLFEDLINFVKEHPQSTHLLDDLVKEKRRVAIGKALWNGLLAVSKPAEAYFKTGWKEGKHYYRD